MNTSSIINSQNGLKGAFYKLFAFTAVNARAFARQHSAVFEGITRMAVPFGGNIVNHRF